MHKSLAMRFVQSVGDLDGEAQQQLHLQATVGEPLGQRFPFQVFHYQKVDAILQSNVIERANVRMAQAGDGACLPLEPLAQPGFARKLIGQNLSIVG